MTEIARLRWQCRRGCKELDLLLNGYLENCYGSATKEDQAYFRHLIKLDDAELLLNQTRYAAFLKQIAEKK